MKNETYGECRFHDKDDHCGFVGFTRPANLSACRNFEPKPTNGDVIRRGGDKALLAYRSNAACYCCSFRDTESCKSDFSNCKDGQLAWLNAPTESGGER